MYIIIAGAGKIGAQLAQILSEEGCDIVVVDPDKEACKRVSTEIDCIAVNDDATDPEVLKEVKVHEADALVALTGSDQTNIVICLIAKQVGAKNVIARLTKMHYDENVLKKIGIDTAVYPESAAAAYISEVITKPNVLDLGFVAKGSAEILEAKVTSQSRIKNKRIKEIQLPEGCSIITIIKNRIMKAPTIETEIKEGDTVLILTPKEKVIDIRKLIK